MNRLHSTMKLRGTLAATMRTLIKVRAGVYKPGKALTKLTLEWEAQAADIVRLLALYGEGYTDIEESLGIQLSTLLTKEVI